MLVLRVFVSYHIFKSVGANLGPTWPEHLVVHKFNNLRKNFSQILIDGACSSVSEGTVTLRAVFAVFLL